MFHHVHEIVINCVCVCVFGGNLIVFKAFFPLFLVTIELMFKRPWHYFCIQGIRPHWGLPKGCLKKQSSRRDSLPLHWKCLDKTSPSAFLDNDLKLSGGPQPSSLHTTILASESKPSLHTETQPWSDLTSTRPQPTSDDPTSLTDSEGQRDQTGHLKKKEPTVSVSRPDPL